MHKSKLTVIYGTVTLFEPHSDYNQEYVCFFEADTKAECEADIAKFLAEWKTTGFTTIGLNLVPFHQIKQAHISHE